MTRYRCGNCDSVSTDNELMTGPSPFSADELTACPHCRSVFGEQAQEICDQTGCDREATCGWPSEQGYRRTCGEHAA